MNRVQVGSYTGTGAPINIQLGFEPAFVIIWNVTDGDVVFNWFKGMAAGTALKVDAAAAPVSSNGITLYTGTRGGNAKGITVGTALSEDTKVFRYAAFRED